MDKFVKEKLSEWNLSKFIEKFEEAGIDEEIFSIIDEEMLDFLFDKSQCGFKKKFQLKMQEWVTKNSECEINHLVPSTFVSPLGRKSIRALLNTTVRGIIVLGTFEKDGIVNQTTLSDLVIEYEFEFTQTFRILEDRFIALATETGEIFATPNKSASEVALEFFWPYQKGVDGHQAVAAGGIYNDKYYSLRKKLIKCGQINRTEVLFGDSNVHTDIHENIKWLKENTKPINDVLNKWEETFSDREPCKEVAHYFTLYKCLSSAIGHRLLSNDFKKIYPHCATNLLDTWHTTSKLIIQLVQKKNKSHASDQALINAGKEDFLAFVCLTRILGILIRKRKNTDQTFGSTEEDVKNSFILQVKSYQELTKYENFRKEQAIQLGHKIGSYVVIVGDLIAPEENEIEVHPINYEVLVIINHIRYKVESNSIIEAVDHCYKSSIVLNIDFSAQSRHIWTFIHKYVYNISLKSDKPYKLVTELINDLKQATATLNS